MHNKKQILSLQGIRAMMFILIFFFHSDLFLDRYFVFNRFFIGGGTLAVSVFFILSGFVTGLSRKHIHCVKEYTSYIKSKISRFYFFHLFFLILSIPLSYNFFLHDKKGLVSLILDFLLLQSWVPDPTVWRSYNGLAWFLSTLLFCYLLLPFVEYLFGNLLSKLQPKWKIFYLMQIMVLKM
jgi:peptidoglycan/LPS O-acetylase OafA/YrhL